MRKELLVILVLMLAVNATYLNIREPVISSGMSDGSSLYIGIAAPGQTVYVVAERATIDAAGESINYMGWDKLAVEGLPPGWVGEDSPWYETPMKAKIRIAPDAADGRYVFKIKAVDEGNYDGLGELTINVSVAVSKEVFNIDVTPLTVETGVGQPGVYYIDIENMGAASDTFRIKSSGVPAWRFSKDVLVPHAVDPSLAAKKTVPYEVVLNEQSEVDVHINVTSLSSEQISREMRVRLIAKPSLISDYRATGHGLLVFPLVESPIYSLMAFFSKLLL
ncbi:MAG: hypothetical protein QXF56_01625 [Candidatus Micrarchaeia archaeon]